VTQAKVKEDFGQGRMFGAKDAMARGMADRVATLDQVITGMVAKMPARAPRAAAPRSRSSSSPAIPAFSVAHPRRRTAGVRALMSGFTHRSC
jgi:ClpP class serine protease